MVADDEQLERRVLTSILKKNVRVKEIIEKKWKRSFRIK